MLVGPRSAGESDSALARPVAIGEGVAATDLGNAYQASFCEVKAPYLRVFRCECKNSQTVPCDVFEAAPALATIDIWSHDQTLFDGVALRAISAALRRGALQNLQELNMQNCIVDDGNLRDLMDDLERSGCAARLATLRCAPWRTFCAKTPFQH